MFTIIGIVVVFGAVIAGYLMEKGPLAVLIQPAELIIILGAAIGTVLIANPLHILTKIGGGIAGVFGSSPFTKQRYLESLKMMYELFGRARRDGMMALESDSDAPDKSAIFSKYPVLPEGSPRTRFRLRFDPHGVERQHRAIRRRSDDRTRYGRAPS